MGKNQRIDRRKFMQGSVSLIGAKSFSRWKAAGGAWETMNTSLTMQATSDGRQTACILTGSGVTFQEQLAARELARGLRNLGLVREPRLRNGCGRDRASDFVFSLLVDKQAFRHPRRTRSPEGRKRQVTPNTT